MNIYGKSYITKLKAHANQKVGTESSFSDKTKPPYIPLTQQVQDLAKSMPSKMFHRPWSMEELVIRLSGKYRERPHPQKISIALRLLNWKRLRYWKNGYGGIRVWVPPE